MNERSGYLLIVTASIIWGTMGIFGKFAFAYGINPVTLTALRILISSATLLVPLAFSKRKLLRVCRKDMPRLLILGIFGVALQRISYFYAVDLTTATIAAVLFYTYPVFVSLYAALFRKERITPSIVVAMILAFSGVVFTVKAYQASWLSANLLGLVFGMLTSLLFAVYFLVTRKLRDSYTNWTLLVFGDGIGAVALAPLLCFSVSEIISYPQPLWMLIIVIALFPSLIGYLIFSFALRYVEPSRGSILSVIEPLSAAAFSVAVLGETFEPLQLAGVVLVLAGVTILFYKPKQG
jgi:drug/metabolite transporter (DMT)-like permease